MRILELLRLTKKIQPVRAICQRGEKKVLTWCKGSGGWVGGLFPRISS